ncbi:AAA family ATPase [Thiopseudomonas alkaliphila]|uniref:AAA family ATPase n=1 Tax=Thiopseudomonas alkaliphila TaxID=1697053 RepID=UPI002575EF37|nr:ATP-binding protein [Thiopseudomonas alkaliphila]MDM1708509.1 AAA family ATPase [Thiopseudomonas alkaliphila]
MLRRLRVKNFQSIRDEVEVSLLLNARAPSDFRTLKTIDEQKATKVLALIGANGSGKTNVLKTLAFLHWFIKDSFIGLKPEDPIPVSPHFANQEHPIEFELEFELQGKIWLYQLTLNEQQVLHESLYRKDYRFVYIFKRDWNEQAQSYVIKLKDEFDFSLKEAQKVRLNASLIATAAQYGQSLATQLTQLNVRTNLTMMGKYSFSDFEQLLTAAETVQQQPELLQKLSRLLANWDLGLSEVRIKQEQVTDKAGNKQTLYIPMGLHQVDDQSYELMLWQESSGTRSAFVLLSKLLPILQAGGLVVIDELESDLHPHMLAAILDLFFVPEINQHNAQLIFSTHSHEVLNMLCKEQIVLVEKDAELSTEAYRLDEVEGIRADDNIYAKYMAGAYGAIPEI